MSNFSNYNDGSQTPPRLRIGQALWGMHGLPINAPDEWAVDEKIRRAKEAGFEHLECFDLNNERGEQVRQALKEHGLRLALGHRALTLADTREVIELGAQWGADWVACQPGTAFLSIQEVAAMMKECAKIAADNGLLFFVETHRNTFTESITQTLQLIEAVPDIKITADFSHFIVGGEFYGGQDVIQRLRPIMERAGHVHGRVSNGAQVQVDVGDGHGGNGAADFFRQIWRELFRVWKSSAKPGDVLPFTPELGPPQYAITLPDGREFSDRWEQALVIKKMAEEEWEKA